MGQGAAAGFDGSLKLDSMTPSSLVRLWYQPLLPSHGPNHRAPGGGRGEGGGGLLNFLGASAKSCCRVCVLSWGRLYSAPGRQRAPGPRRSHDVNASPCVRKNQVVDLRGSCAGSTLNLPAVVWLIFLNALMLE